MFEARHVTLNDDAVDNFAKEIVQSVNNKGNLMQPVEWDECGWHFSDGGSPLTCQYIFVMDTLNFCFWPTENNFEYDTLAISLKNILEEDRDAFCAENLLIMTPVSLVL
jgi:hypothetical protein